MSSEASSYVLVFGASVVDIYGYTNVTYIPLNSNPGMVRIAYGGVCRNVAENLAKVGVNTKLISILGDDEMGRGMMAHAKKVGYDMSESLVTSKGGTPTYMAILNEDGEMVSAVVDMKSIDQLSETFIDERGESIAGAEYVIVDSDNPGKLEYMLKRYAKQTKFILDPVSAAKAESVKHLLPFFHTIKPNRHEAEVMAGFGIKDEQTLREAAQVFHKKGVKKVFISLDSEGIFYSDGKDQGLIKANEANVINVTGAGDAFVAGLGYSYMNSLSIQETVKFSIAMSLATISNEHTIHPNMGTSLINRILERTTWSETVL